MAIEELEKKFSLKEKIAQILVDELDYAYCDNCGTVDCDECHRKYQQWSLSFDTALDLADKILEMQKEDK